MADSDSDLLAEWKAAFTRADVDGSGVVDASELGNMLRYYGANPTETEVGCPP